MESIVIELKYTPLLLSNISMGSFDNYIYISSVVQPVVFNTQVEIVVLEETTIKKV